MVAFTVLSWMVQVEVYYKWVSFWKKKESSRIARGREYDVEELSKRRDRLAVRRINNNN